MLWLYTSAKLIWRFTTSSRPELSRWFNSRISWANTKNRLVYASNNNEIAGNNRAGVVKVIWFSAVKNLILKSYSYRISRSIVIMQIIQVWKLGPPFIREYILANSSNEKSVHLKTNNFQRVRELSRKQQGVLSLALLERPLFEDDKIEAWKYGPVVPSIYHEFKEC